MKCRRSARLALAALAVACGPPAAEPPLASWDGGAISCADLAEFALRQGGASASEIDPGDKRELLDRLVLTEELVARAIAAGLDRDPEVEARWEEKRAALRVQALRRQVAEQVSVDPAEVEAFYRDNPLLFSFPEQRSSRVLVLKLPRDASPGQVAARQEELLAIRAQFLAGAKFVDLVKRYSEAENAVRGGGLPMVPRGELPSSIDDVVWRLDPGEVSQPIRVPGGLALVYVLKHVDPVSHSLETSRESIERRLRAETAEAMLQELLSEARETWPLDFDWERALASDTDVDEALGTLGGAELSLASLGLAHRPPRLHEQIDLALERRWLTLLAGDRDLEAARPRLEAALRMAYREELAASYLDRAAAARVKISDEELRAAFDGNRERLVERERRSFLAVSVPGSEGALRPALERAEAIAREWTEPIPSSLPADLRLERWGPLLRHQLLSHTSPELAERAFELQPGATSPPMRLDRYLQQTMRFRPEGYVLLRVLEIQPERSLSLDEARAIQAQWLAEPTRSAMVRLREEVEASMGAVRVDEDRLSECAWEAPLPAAGDPPAGDARPGRTP